MPGELLSRIRRQLRRYILGSVVFKFWSSLGLKFSVCLLRDRESAELIISISLWKRLPDGQMSPDHVLRGLLSLGPLRQLSLCSWEAISENKHRNKGKGCSQSSLDSRWSSYSGFFEQALCNLKGAEQVGKHHRSPPRSWASSKDESSWVNSAGLSWVPGTSDSSFQAWRYKDKVPACPPQLHHLAVMSDAQWGPGDVPKVIQPSAGGSFETRNWNLLGKYIMSADNVPGIVWFLGALENRQRRPLILEAFPFRGQKGKAVGGGDLRRSCDFTLHRLQKLPRTELGVSSWGSVLRRDSVNCRI